MKTEKINNDHYKKILLRTASDTGVDTAVLDTILKCFLYELCESLATINTVQLPYVGDISHRNGTYSGTKIVRSLRKRGGSHVFKFRGLRKEALIRNAEERERSSRGITGSGVDSGVQPNGESDQHQHKEVESTGS